MPGKEFEDLVARLCWKYRKDGTASITRYGVQSIRTAKEIITIKSLPDFEGLVRTDSGSTPVIFDCKVCSQASFDLAPYRDKKKRQLEHMLERSEYGAKCGFLIHWNERLLKKKTWGSETFWMPVHELDPIWMEFRSVERRRITREDCHEFGREVAWENKKPDLMSLFLSLVSESKKHELED